MTRDELRIRISATLMANAARRAATRMDAVMAEVDRYLDEFEADAADELAARLPEIAAAERERIADALRTRATGGIITGRIAEAFDVPPELLASDVVMIPKPPRLAAMGTLRLPNGEEMTVPAPTARLNRMSLNAKGEWVRL